MICAIKNRVVVLMAVAKIQKFILQGENNEVEKFKSDK